MDFLGALLSLPVKVASDLLSPRIRDLLTAAAERHKQKKIATLRAQLFKLTGVRDPTSEAPSKVKQPIITFSDISFVGMHPTGTNMEWRGQSFYVYNTEKRFGIPAYKMDAHLIFKSARGRTVEVEYAPWFHNHVDNPPGRHFKPDVTLGTMERAGVVLLIEIGGEFFTAKYESDLHPVPDKVLSLGEWDVRLTIDGHNVDKVYRFTIQLVPGNITATVPSPQKLSDSLDDSLSPCDNSIR